MEIIMRDATKAEVELWKFQNWEQRNHDKLMESWINYTNAVLPLSYSEYCSRFFNGNLENVVKKSYYNSLP
jgi:hypothetical protein